MLTRQRKDHLLERLARERRIVARDAADALGVSEDTIRRDLRELAREGKLRRVHGGALPVAAAEQGLAARGDIATDEKRAIGRAAAAMVRPGQVVFVDGGTTAIQLARALDRTLAVTIVTHSPLVAAELAGHAVAIRLIGGALFRHSMVAVGAETVQSIRAIRADLCFLGVTGVHAEAGFTTGDAEEALVKRAIAESSAEVVVLASSEKLGAASAFAIGPLELATTLLVSGAVPETQLATIRGTGLEIVRAA
jgi:DeoR/GlpR family transcriptional regulator of sugar metabolism